MPECACGCGEITAGGTYRPGHDAKLRAAIEESVGGLLAMDELIRDVRRHADGELTAEQLSQSVLRILRQ
jgi:hypothetical protein